MNTQRSIHIQLCETTKGDSLPYLPVSALGVGRTGSPIPACGGPRKRSEAGRSRADCAAYKSVA